MKKSPLELLVQTCSSIESNLYHSSHPVLNKCTTPYSQANQKVQSSLQKINNTESSRTLNKNLCLIKNDVKLENEQNNLKRFSINSTDTVTPSPKRKKLTPTVLQSNTTNNLLNSADKNFKFCQKPLSIYPKHEYMLTPQLLNNNLNQKFLKNPELNDPSRNYACNWMIGNVVCGRNFFTTEELLLHLQSHATESSIQQMHNFYSNQLYSLKSFYNILQQQNMAQIAQITAQNTFGSLPMNNYPDTYTQNNFHTHLSPYRKLYGLPGKPT